MDLECVLHFYIKKKKKKKITLKNELTTGWPIFAPRPKIFKQVRVISFGFELGVTEPFPISPNLNTCMIHIRYKNNMIFF